LREVILFKELAMKVNNKLFITTLFAGVIGFGVVPAQAAGVTVLGGDTSSWEIIDDGITDNGLPSGGTCSTGADGSGASIRDANIPAGSDAFDYAGMVWVNSTQVGGNLSGSGNRVTFSPVIISGLNAQVIYDVLSTSATLRVLLTLENPTGSPIAVPVDYASNFGSDGGTAVKGTSSGDTSFTSADSWVVTSDAGDSDPVNTTVIFGAGAAPVTPSSVSQTVFGCAGTQGVQATFNVSVPAGGTIAMVFFQQMNDTTANALTEATVFDDPNLDPDLLAGLSPSELAAIQNWDLVASPPPPTATAAVPTMGIWGIGMLSGMIGLLGMYHRRRK
jgi:hypothetical protein